MRLVVQRVTDASVEVDNAIVGKIEEGVGSEEVVEHRRHRIHDEDAVW